MELILEAKIFDRREKAFNYHSIHSFGFDKKEALAFGKADIKSRIHREFEYLDSVTILEEIPHKVEIDTSVPKEWSRMKKHDKI